jgi:hypothetical protein
MDETKREYPVSRRIKMLDVYKRYKEWFELTSYLRSAWPVTFEEHVNSMTLFEFMETLVSWESLDD